MGHEFLRGPQQQQRDPAGTGALRARERRRRSTRDSAANQYTVVATGEVQDNYTKLIWEQATHQPAMDFATASALCSGLALNGHSFRLPTVNELSTLVDDTRVAPAINRTMFPDTVWAAATNTTTGRKTRGQAARPGPGGASTTTMVTPVTGD